MLGRLALDQHVQVAVESGAGRLVSLGRLHAEARQRAGQAAAPGNVVVVARRGEGAPVRDGALVPDLKVAGQASGADNELSLDRRRRGPPLRFIGRCLLGRLGGSPRGS